MKRKISAILAGVLVLSLTVGSPAGRADAATSNANIVFTPGTGPTMPVDPDDPSKPAGDGGDGATGSLIIVSITDFDFGEIPLSIGAVHQPITIEKPNIQTVDLRGVGSGWHVTAQMAQFQNAQSQPSLLGAAITIAGGNPISEFALTAPENTENVTLTAGSLDPTKVISAAADAGLGLWVMRWYPTEGTDKYIHLDIPVGRAETGTHSAVITWTLTDGP